MPALNSSDLFVTQMEKVEDKLEDAFETTDSVAALFRSRVVQDVETNSKLFRRPFKLARGAAYGAFNPEGGALGRGTGGEYEEFLWARHFTKLNVEWTFKSQIDTKDRSLAKAKATDVITDAVEELQVLADIEAHGDGRGLICHSQGANTANANDGGVTSYVFDHPSDTLGAVNFRRKLYCRVFNNAGTTQKFNNAAGASAAMVVTKVDLDINKVYLDKVIDSSAPAQGDIIVFDGINANITSHANYSGTPPLFPDSWRHGIKYFLDAAQTDYIGGVQRSAIPEVLPTHFDGGGSVATHLMLQAGLDRVFKKRDDKGRKQMIGIMPLAQKYALIEKHVDITSWQRTKQMEDALDLIPSNLTSNDSVFSICGVTWMVSKRQDADRIDTVIPKLMGRCQGYKTQWYTALGGQKIFPAYSADGGLEASFLAYLTQSFNYFMDDPGKLVYWTGLGRPDGY